MSPREDRRDPPHGTPSFPPPHPAPVARRELKLCAATCGCERSGAFFFSRLSRNGKGSSEGISVLLLPRLWRLRRPPKQEGASGKQASVKGRRKGEKASLGTRPVSVLGGGVKRKLETATLPLAILIRFTIGLWKLSCLGRAGEVRKEKEVPFATGSKATCRGVEMRLLLPH